MLTEFLNKFYLLRLITSDGYKNDSENVAKEVTTPFQIFEAVLGGHFPRSKVEVALGPECSAAFSQTERGSIPNHLSFLVSSPLLPITAHRAEQER